MRIPQDLVNQAVAGRWVGAGSVLRTWQSTTNMRMTPKHTSQRTSRPYRWVRRVSAVVLSVAVVWLGLCDPAATCPQTPSKGEAGRGASDGPRITVTPEQINLGKVRLGKRVRASFTITNAGNRLLRFTQAPYAEVKSGCCPPVVMLASWALKPGEHTTLSTEFVMVGKRQGPYDVRVHLPTNDPIEPDRTVAVLSNWVP
jgi:hypothetical protein